jgi:hypothetical protein
VTYSFELTANGCNSSRNLNVTVYPQPGAATITTASPSTVCSGTQFQNFGASSLPASGSTYTWSAQNATIQATGNTSQYCLVNFPDAGNASVTLTVGSGTPCAGVSTYSVAVGNDISATYSVIYYNYNFVFQDNSQDSYQWGYDNVNTLDSTLLPGATFQSYENTNPDFGSNYYWVITVKNGCMQKTYFNGPLATTTPISSAHSRMLKIKPNPAGNQIIISAGPAGSNNGKVIITDIAGQIHLIQNLTGNDTPIDISMLPQGYYLVSHFVNELKISTSRFVKNQE